MVIFNLFGSFLIAAGITLLVLFIYDKNKNRKGNSEYNKNDSNESTTFGRDIPLSVNYIK